MSLDLKIVRATVVDGTGTPWRMADIGICQGRITEVGTVRGSARKRIDGTGLVVCPGFVDVHTHADGILNRPAAENFLRQGVTTLVSGNCGDSAWPIGEMLEKVAAARPSINYGTLVGHGTLRSAVKGCAPGKPSRKETIALCRRFELAMKEGALGLSTGLFYIPGAYAGLDELVAVAQTVAEYGGIYASHVRSAGGQLPRALEETAEIGRRTGIPVHVSHLKTLHRKGRTRKSRAREILDLIKQLRGEGVDMTYDLHPYTATNTSLASVTLPPWVSEDGLREKRLRSPNVRARIRGTVASNIAWMGGPDKIQMVRFPQQRTLEGKTLLAIARDRDETAVTTAMDLVLEGNPSCMFHAIRDADARLFSADDLSMVASDAHVVQTHESLAHPRNFGTFPRILQDYVRNNSLLSLENAIRKMTLFPAIRFGIPNRGALIPGYKADLVLFNAQTVADRTSFQKPMVYPEGIHAVIVNGTVAWRVGSSRINRGCGDVIRGGAAGGN